MIEWREQMSVDDNGVIDQDHKHLIEIINRFEALSEDGLDKDEALQILYALKFYTQTHFNREERFQEIIAFPFADAHHQEHIELIETMDKILAHLDNPDIDIEDQIHQEISEMLHDWLINHTLDSDLKMRQYFRQMKSEMPDLGALKDLEVPFR